MRSAVLVSALILSTAAAAADNPAAAPAPPEVQKTVDAFAGKWTYQATLSAPGMPAPAPAKFMIECSKTALGAAVNCAVKGEITGLGPLEMGCLAGYDAGEKVVHFMVISSAGEYHHHKGTWKDDKTLQFEPLKFKNHGQDATEDFGFTWTGPNAMSFKSVVTNADGSKEVFEGSGTR
jgi:hypothetical protein